MTAIQLRPKQQVRIEGAVYSVTRRAGDGRIVLEDVQTLAPRSLSDDEVAQLFNEGVLSFIQPGAEVETGFDPRLADFTQLPEKDRAGARRREAYVRAATEQGVPRSQPQLKKWIPSFAVQLGDTSPPSASALCRWMRRWETAGGHDIRTLVSRHHARGNRTKRLPREVLDIVDDAISAVYLRRERMTARAAWHKVVADIDRLNQRRSSQEQLPRPSERAVSRRIAAIDRYELTNARYGRRVADHAFRPVGACPRASRALEMVEIDHTKFDCLVVDETGTLLGRPFLTAAIDRYTRMVVGIHLGFEPPSTLTVSNCLRNAIMPKTYVKDVAPDLSADWPCFGIPETIVVDNGPEFHSEAFSDACAQLGINIQYSPVASPWYKGKVERWFGTVAKSFSHQLPGTTFSNTAQRGDYKSETRAAVSYDELVVLLHQWIIDYYIRSPHGGIDDVPLRVWEESTRNHPVRLPARPQDLDVLVGGVVERAVSRKGIQLHGLLYNNEELRSLRTHPGAPSKLTVRFDPSDLGQVLVLCPFTGQYVRVPAIEPEYAAGLTLAQHKVYRRQAGEQKDGYISVEQLCRARDDLRRTIDEFASNRRKVTRSRVARHLGLGSSPLAGELVLGEAAEFMGEQPVSLQGTATPTPVGEAALSRSQADRGLAEQQSTSSEPAAPSEVSNLEYEVLDPAASDDNKDADPSEYEMDVISLGEHSKPKER